MRLLLDNLRIDEHVTAIHCTHSKPEDLREFASRGGRVCVCPITEGNLSDGFPDVPLMRESNVPICIGTDSNVRLSMMEELRWLEFGQRLRREKRGIVVDKAGSCASALLELGTRNGAAALGIEAGEIAAGRFADLIAVDLDHPSIRGAQEPEAILDSLIFGSGNGPIDQVWVGGGEIKRPRAMT
jgi:cytosine/adenosine deaminase-related metal-dependent hydrolase